MLQEKFKDKVFDYLRNHIDIRLPILLGLSGGPDSTALLFLLRQFPGLKLAAAHIDHGWRAESASEALILKKLTEEMGVPFHSLTLDPLRLEGNLEEASRNERLKFFRSLCEEHGYQGVVLGHHRDDQAETVLKRVLEGAPLLRFAGISPIKVHDGLTLFRPLLGAVKDEILDYVKTLPFTPFIDRTNFDERYLRAKMRKNILPSLSKEFGKGIAGNLAYVAEEAQELALYLDAIVAPHYDALIQGPLGCCLDLQSSEELHPFILKHLIRRVLESVHTALSREQLSILVDLVISGASDRCVKNKECTVYVDRRRLFFVKTAIPLIESTLSLSDEPFSLGRWRVSVDAAVNGVAPHTGWKAAWQGELSINLPYGEYTIGIASAAVLMRSGTALGKFWTNEKVPAFMRSYVPVIFSEGKAVHEFLSGRFAKGNAENRVHVRLVLIKEKEG